MAQLRCENISVGYEDGIVVSDVSFELNRGDYVCIVGENGAGKSSLLKGILGLAKIQGGKLEYGDGMSRADVGYLPQQKDYQKNFPATVKEVVMSGFLNKMGLRPYYNRAEKAKAMEILSDFGMADYVRLPSEVSREDRSRGCFLPGRCARRTSFCFSMSRPQGLIRLLRRSSMSC